MVPCSKVWSPWEKDVYFFKEPTLSPAPFSQTTSMCLEARELVHPREGVK